MSRIRTNLITNRMANGAPTVSNGLVISGVTTVTTLDLNGDLDVDGHLNADNVSIAGVVTATSFVGSGANLTGITQTTINNNANNRLITGSGTANTLEGETSLTYDGATLLATSSNFVLKGVDTNSNNSECFIQFNQGKINLSADNNNATGASGIEFTVDGTYAADFSTTGFIPVTNNAIDLGSTSKRWRNVYTTDLQLSNEGKTNDVDGTWGNYTIQEGESDLFLINNRSGKKYKFNLTEVL